MLMLGIFGAYSRGTALAGFGGQFFLIFEIVLIWFVVATFNLVHDVAAIHDLCTLLIASGNLF